MKRIYKVLIVIVLLIIGYYTYLYIKEKTTDYGHKVVLCVPIYGQSLALGEEAVRITNFDSLRINYNGRIVTQNLDYVFGYIDDDISRQNFKKLIHYNKRSFELSAYRMAEELSTQLGEDTIICIFTGGTGMSKITVMNKTTPIYDKFLYELEQAYTKAKDRGWEFYVPAVCWIQGESDIIEYSQYDYKQLLVQFRDDINKDIKRITKQTNDIPLITYQSNVITRAEAFNANNYDVAEMKVPQTYVDLIKEDSLFWASGPIYPYTYVNERLHIDAIGQQHMGYLNAIAVMNIIRDKGKTFGLTPISVSSEKNDVLVRFNVPYPPLVIDTISVMPIDHYGFSVISNSNENILTGISIEGDVVRLTCSQSPINCMIRYGVNGERMKSGNIHGPRGNLRDSQGEKEMFTIGGKTYPVHNWAYQFNILCK